MNILSLFDGISCGQLALQRSGVKVKKYFSSEINKHAIQVTQKNFPNTIQLGDIQKLDLAELPKIDLLMGGSPCQGFSLAGKKLNFDDPRSALFFDFAKILKALKPAYFLLENVRMKKDFQDVITSYLGVEPVLVNSALVSAQNRRRLYWSNLPIQQPADKGISVVDIIEDGAAKIGAWRGRYLIDGIRQGHTVQKLEIRRDKKSNALTTVKKDNVVILYRLGHGGTKESLLLRKKYPCLTSNNPGTHYRLIVNTEHLGQHVQEELKKTGVLTRQLTPVECERLQTIPDNYTEGIPKTARYKAIGNGWTVDIISHILKEIINDKYK